MKRNLILFTTYILLMSCAAPPKPESLEQKDSVVTTGQYNELHRPQLHFSPPKNWMNDPNGLVFHNGEYHLFYQHYPAGNKWGPMHWGHAISKDLVRWENHPIALYPDSLGLIFSGSAVVDKDNTSGLGTKENPPLVAIFTYHSLEKEKAGRTDYQSQGLAFSTDNGRSWQKYEKNPVLKNQGVKDFRDPKVFWHEETSKWVMILAVKDHTELWGSEDLKQWSKLSDFGADFGAHGGVWECPDLFKVKVEGSNEEKWVMLVSLNPGGPNGGSGTQYFTGSFDGKTFTPLETKKETKWMDYGPENYAGVTWSNAPDDRKIFIGWMSNWAYAEQVPTTEWRSATTLPREFSLVKTNNEYFLRSTLVPELASIASNEIPQQVSFTSDSIHLNSEISTSLIKGKIAARDFRLRLSNTKGQYIIIGYNSGKNEYFIDRSKAGSNDFAANFPGNVFGKRLSTAAEISFTIVVDVSSVEVFFDDGLSVMTALYFPDEVMSSATLYGSGQQKVENLSVVNLRSIWK
jgi:fructan beta-fructosidase